MDRRPSAVLAGIPAGRAAPYVSQLRAQLTPWGDPCSDHSQPATPLIGDVRDDQLEQRGQHGVGIHPATLLSAAMRSPVSGDGVTVILG
jgi:hypothetical protein